jgi:pyrroline-5-carboxylate reductase
MAEQTFIGASALLEKGEKSSGEFKQAVMSPGGTTEAAINSLEEGNLKDTVFNAVQKAKERADELSQLV